MVGGLGPANPPDEEIRAIVTSLRGSVEDSKKVQYTAFEVHSYRSQVVAGTNYFIKVKASVAGAADSFLLLRVYKPLPHTGQGPQLAGIKDVGESEEIAHFE
mmetsp:Transcript_8824/g.25701  ORF Transcript_8824/g.25701 Transcript_8824/m.25701 type:complete len:102 (+) Transcript_8824:46-351(+)